MLYLACGNQDLFVADNRRFVERLTARKIPYEYRELSPFGHSWDVWDGQLVSFVEMMSDASWANGPGTTVEMPHTDSEESDVVEPRRLSGKLDGGATRDCNRAEGELVRRPLGLIATPLAHPDAGGWPGPGRDD